jgi:hippurate hydrolase
MHNIPDIGLGSFGLCSGPMMAAVDLLHYVVTSPGGHAAMPHSTVDTLVVSAEVLLALQTIVSRNVDPMLQAVVSITQVHGGHADNIIPSRVEHGGCVRTFLPEVQSLVEKRIDTLLDGITRAHGAGYELDYQTIYPATVNTEAEVAQAADAAGRIGEVSTEIVPIMASEDFSFMLQERPGAFIFAGNGPSAGLHTPLYEFNDDLLEIGARYWATLVETQLAH